MRISPWSILTRGLEVIQGDAVLTIPFLLFYVLIVFGKDFILDPSGVLIPLVLNFVFLYVVIYANKYLEKLPENPTNLLAWFFRRLPGIIGLSLVEMVAFAAAAALARIALVLLELLLAPFSPGLVLSLYTYRLLIAGTVALVLTFPPFLLAYLALLLEELPVFEAVRRGYVLFVENRLEVFLILFSLAVIFACVMTASSLLIRPLYAYPFGFYLIYLWWAFWMALASTYSTVTSLILYKSISSRDLA